MASSSTGMGNGHRKIKIKKINSKSKLEVTFSKCKNNVFNKASKLSTLTGSEIAIIVSSPGGKVHTFGHPSVKAVIDKFLIAKAKEELTAIQEKLEWEKKRGEALEMMLGGSQEWRRLDVDGQNITELKQSFEDIMNLKIDLEREIEARGLQGKQSSGVEGVGIDGGEVL